MIETEIFRLADVGLKMTDKNMETKSFSHQFYRTTLEAWDAMYQAVLGAKKSIYWEIYIFLDDQAGARFVDALCNKAQAGVEVKIVVDAIGSWGLSRAAAKRLAEAGAEVRWYNRLHPELAVGKWWRRLWRRNHRKLLIVDEEIAFVGGVNVESKAVEWDDLFLKLTGTLVQPLLKSFAKSYIASGGSRKKIRHLRHPELYRGLEAWQERLKYVIHSPGKRQSSVRQLYHQSLLAAKESVNVLTPYFIPDKTFLKFVSQARRRGVKVNVFLPLRADHWFMGLIARAYYGLAHRSGVNLYFLNKMNHGKAITVDRQAGFVGSSNVTPRSWFLNEESGVYFDDQTMVDDLNAIFEDLKKDAAPLDFEHWTKRGWASRFKEWWARRIERYV